MGGCCSSPEDGNLTNLASSGVTGAAALVSEKRRQSSDGVKTLMGPDLTLRYAWMTQAGYYPENLNKANQDSFVCIPSFNDEESRHFFGVFDGHGKLPGMLQKNPYFHRDFERAYVECFEECNRSLHRQVHNAIAPIDDTLSGTTGITVVFDGTTIYVANVGDSRAIVGEKKGTKLVAYPLSIDQTPYRKDELSRVEDCGARVLTMDQIDGYKSMSFREWGEEEDDDGDPPRVWLSESRFPGTAFTRSIGDSCAETVGVHATPEILSKTLTPNDKYLVIASDGVWEFITSQQVMNIVEKCNDPMEACKVLVAESYKLWLQFEIRTDDITVIVIALDGMIKKRETAMRAKLGSCSNIQTGASVVISGEAKPVRNTFSRRKRKLIINNEGDVNLDDILEEEEVDEIEKEFSGTAAENRRLREALRTNFLFQPLSQEQREKVLNTLVKRPVKKGDVIINQGAEGDSLFVVDQGRFEVWITPSFDEEEDDAESSTPGGRPMEDDGLHSKKKLNRATKPMMVHVYDSAEGNPTFGELALLHSRPRAASVRAATDGVLWALDRKTFRTFLMRATARKQRLLRALRNERKLDHMSRSHKQRMSDLFLEESYEDGQEIQACHISCIVPAIGQLVLREADKPDVYYDKWAVIGTDALNRNQWMQGKIFAVGRVVVLRLSVTSFEQAFGTFGDVIARHEAMEVRRRVDSALLPAVKLREGLSDTKLKDFVVQDLVLPLDLGQIRRVFHRASGRHFCLKIISKQAALDAGMVMNVMNERRILESEGNFRRCRFIPQIAATFPCPGKDFMITLLKTQMRSGLSLASVLASQKLCESDIQLLTGMLVVALGKLHENGIVYRGLDSEQITFTEGGLVQLHDLRFSKAVDTGFTYTVCGDVEYMSPEQVSQAGHDAGADWWSLGVIVYEMMYGKRPFVGKTELETFNLIASHPGGPIKVPMEGPKYSSACLDFVSNCLEPLAKRIGCQGDDEEELLGHRWFARMKLRDMAKGILTPTIDWKKALAAVDIEALKNTEINLKQPWSGDEDLFEGF